MFKNRARMVILLMALVAGSVGFVVFAASQAPATQAQKSQTVTGQATPAASQGTPTTTNESESAAEDNGAKETASEATNASETQANAEAASESTGESENATAEDGPGGSQHQFQGQETGNH